MFYDPNYQMTSPPLDMLPYGQTPQDNATLTQMMSGIPAAYSGQSGDGNMVNPGMLGGMLSGRLMSSGWIPSILGSIIGGYLYDNRKDLYNKYVTNLPQMAGDAMLSPYPFSPPFTYPYPPSPPSPMGPSFRGPVDQIPIMGNWI